MRVLHLTRDYPPHHCGGISKATASTVTALRRDDVATAVVSFDRWRRRDPGGDVFTRHRGVVPLRIRRGEPFEEVRAVASDFAPDLVHLHHENLWEYARDLRRRLGCPVVYGVHILQQARAMDSDGRGAAAALGPASSMADQGDALRGADLVVAPSRFALRAIGATQGDVAARLVPNIVEVPTAALGNAAASVASYAGRFDHAKGTDVLFDVMELALRAEPELRFEIAGGLPASSKRERRWRRRWQDRAPAGTGDRAVFHGWLDDDSLDRMYRRARVHIVPSRCETFGLSAAEAMARSVPVVASNAGALPEIVADGETGLLADADDPGALSERLLSLVRDRRGAAEMGSRASLAIRRRFTAAVVLPILLAAYRDALAGRQRRSQEQPA